MEFILVMLNEVKHLARVSARLSRLRRIAYNRSLGCD